MQSVNRNMESAAGHSTTNSPGLGALLIDRCSCTDQGIGCEDDHHGGSGFTINGRHWGPVRVRGCTYRAGFDQPLKEAVWRNTQDKSQPPFNGALVVSRGQACERSRYVQISDNDFAVASGCGDRELVQLEGADRIIFSNNTLSSGANFNTVAVDAVDSANSSLCGFGCRTPGSTGCLPSVDSSWMAAGALQYSCNNRANNRTTYRGRSVPALCRDDCCKPPE